VAAVSEGVADVSLEDTSHFDEWSEPQVRRLSRNARPVALKQNHPAKIVANQLEVHWQVIANSGEGNR
jgi:hypothetical protein